MQSQENMSTFRVPLPEGQAFCSFSWEEETPGALRIERACYVDAPAETDTRQASGVPEGADGVCLALVIATWRRPMEVSRLEETYRDACRNRPDFARHSHLFIVNNDPLAMGAFPLKSDRLLTVLHSPANIGGAGAFALGARRALEMGVFSHVVFMDDDVFIQEESWFRTLSLLRRLKPEYRDQIVSGAMLKQEEPCFCHVMQEAIDSRSLAVTLSGDRDIRKTEDVFRLLSDVRTEASDIWRSGKIRPYAAWWYCVLPSALFAEYGFPLPLFFRGDDQEFGLRVGRMTLPLNGIFVWHPAFERKRSLLRIYLGFRNGAVTALLHLPGWRGVVFRRLLLNAWRDLVSGRHSACALRVLALQDFMHFSRLPEDGDRLTERLGKWLAFFQVGRRPPTHKEPETCPFAPAQALRLAVLVFLCAWRLWHFDASRARTEFETLMRQADAPGPVNRFAPRQSARKAKTVYPLLQL